MQNIYVYNREDKVGRLMYYRGTFIYPYVVTYSHRPVRNCMVYDKHEIKLLHKKPLRYFIEKRQGE